MTFSLLLHCIVLLNVKFRIDSLVHILYIVGQCGATVLIRHNMLKTFKWISFGLGMRAQNSRTFFQFMHKMNNRCNLMLLPLLLLLLLLFTLLQAIHLKIISNRTLCFVAVKIVVCVVCSI